MKNTVLEVELHAVGLPQTGYNRRRHHVVEYVQEVQTTRARGWEAGRCGPARVPGCGARRGREENPAANPIPCQCTSKLAWLPLPLPSPVLQQGSGSNLLRGEVRAGSGSQPHLGKVSVSTPVLTGLSLPITRPTEEYLKDVMLKLDILGVPGIPEPRIITFSIVAKTGSL